MRLVAAYITENDCDWLELSIKSIIDGVDKVYVVYSPTKHDDTIEMLKQFGDKIDVTVVYYPHESKGANGMQRNQYLEILKEREMGSWCLVLDSDEVVNDIKRLRENLKYGSSDPTDCLNVKMRHLQKSLCHEDATVPEHYVINRLFKVNPDLYYDEVEHPVLKGWTNHAMTNVVTIWHLAYAKECADILKKYKNHLAKSNIHTPEFLRWWYLSHIFDKYPKKEFSPAELPKAIKEHFLLEDIEDELYFETRKQMEPKHLLDAYTWRDKFQLIGEKILNCGDGMGHRTAACLQVGMDAYGFDINKWAVKNNPYQNIPLSIASITDTPKPEQCECFKLVTAYDLLEHLTKDEIKVALQNMYNWSKKYILISVPVIGDPNLEADPTHITKETMDWWKAEVMRAGFKILDVPDNFLFKHQLIIGEKQ